jgi:hypothetical protein
VIKRSLYSNILTNDEEIRESGRLLLPPESIETFNLISDINNLGALGEPIIFLNPNTIAICRLNPDALNWEITGIVAPGPGFPNKTIEITNINPAINRSIRFLNNDPGSAAENRILLQLNFVLLLPNETFTLRYDNSVQRWRPLSKE